MRFYLGLGYHSPGELIGLARHAESVGFHGVTFGDHVAVAPEPATPYPSADGRPSFASDTPWPDIWTLIGGLATTTSTLRFLTTIYLLPLRHPLHVAKAASTAALLSDSRVELGVGVGWQRDEFDALGIDYSTRGRRTNEAIEAIRAVWAEGPSEFHGQFYDFGPLITEPTPDRPPRILVGGSSPAAHRRAALLGDGFVTMPASLPELEELVPTLRVRVEAEGRDMHDFAIYANCRTATSTAEYEAVAALGVSGVLVRPHNLHLDDGTTDLRYAMDRFSEDVLRHIAPGEEMT